MVEERIVEREARIFFATKTEVDRFVCGFFSGFARV